MKRGRTNLVQQSKLAIGLSRRIVGAFLLLTGMVMSVAAANDFCPIQPNISRVNNDCRFDTNGSLSLSPTGGVAPYSYNWSNGANSQTINGLAAGSYSFTVTDSEGCAANGSFSVLANDPVVSNPSVNHVECFGEAEGSASLSPSGGVGPYTYNWSNGETTSTITGLTAGVYGYTITDSNGCTNTGDFAVIQPAPVWTTFTQKYACGNNNDGMAEIFANGGTPPYTYSWSNGATTAAINNLPPGMYFYTVTDSRGCQSAGGLVCIFRSFVNASVSASTTSCPNGNNGSASLIVTDGLPPLTFAWSNGATTSSVDNLAPGTYGYTVTDAGGCSDSGTVSIAASSEVFASVMELGNGNLQVTASGGVAPYTYSWSNGETNAVATQYDPGDAYSVTVTDANGCTFTLSGTVPNNSTCPGNFTYAGSIGSDQYFCAPGNTPATLGGVDSPVGGTGPVEYLWMSNSTGGPFLPGFYYPIPNSNSPSYSPGPLDETTYFIRCIRREGCVFIESNTVVVTVDDVLGAVIDRPGLGCAFQTQTYSIENVGPTATVSWDFDGPVQVSSTTGQSVEVTFVGAGYLDVAATVTEDGCTGTYTDRVTIAGNCFGNGNTGGSTESNTITLFPNPVNDWTTLDMGDQATEATEIRVYNATQSLVAVYQLGTDSRRFELDMSTQPAGLYLIQVMGADQPLQSMKLIKN